MQHEKAVSCHIRSCTGHDSDHELHKIRSSLLTEILKEANQPPSLLLCQNNILYHVVPLFFFLQKNSSGKTLQ